MNKLYPLWMDIAKEEIGTKEIKGKDHNPKIIEYHSYTKLKSTSDEVSWCSAFACFCVEKAGFRSPKSAMARQWLAWGNPVDNPFYGCVVVLWRNDINSWTGHVGFYVKEDEKYIYVLGGNQNDEVNIKPYKKVQLLGYRWPKTQI